MALTSAPAAGAKLRASVLSAIVVERTILVARCASDQVLTASTTNYQAVTDLVIAVVANASYVGELAVAAQNASSNAEDVKIHFAFPAGAAMDHLGLRLLTSSTAVSGDVDATARLAITSGVVGAPGGGQGFATIAANPTDAIEKFTLRTGGSAGNLQVLAAQLTSGAPVTSIKAGSFLTLLRYA